VPLIDLAQNPTRPSFITPFGLAVEACSEFRNQVQFDWACLRLLGMNRKS